MCLCYCSREKETNKQTNCVLVLVSVYIKRTEVVGGQWKDGLKTWGL
jgi:hypothetical protein